MDRCIEIAISGALISCTSEGLRRLLNSGIGVRLPLWQMHRDAALDATILERLREGSLGAVMARRLFARWDRFWADDDGREKAIQVRQTHAVVGRTVGTQIAIQRREVDRRDVVFHGFSNRFAEAACSCKLHTASHGCTNRGMACADPWQRFGATLRNPSGAAAYPAGPTTKPTSLSDPSRSHRGRQHPLSLRQSAGRYRILRRRDHVSGAAADTSQAPGGCHSISAAVTVHR